MICKFQIYVKYEWSSGKIIAPFVKLYFSE